MDQWISRLGLSLHPQVDLAPTLIQIRLLDVPKGAVILGWITTGLLDIVVMSNSRGKLTWSVVDLESVLMFYLFENRTDLNKPTWYKSSMEYWKGSKLLGLVEMGLLESV